MLLSAYACEPGGGSELAIGWENVRALAPLHNLTVLTRSKYRDAIETEVARVGGPLTSVQFRYLDTGGLPEESLERTHTGENVVYMRWQARARRWLADHAGEFDVAHHVTWVRYWMVPGVSSHRDVPCVIGPVGGADDAPPVLLATLSRLGRLSGWFRRAVRSVVSADPSLRRALTSSTICLATSAATKKALLDLGAPVVRLASDVVASSDDLLDERQQPPAEPPIVVCAGRLIEWKAYHLAIEAWARARIDGQLVIFGDGPSLKRLQQLARDLGVSDRVQLRGLVPRAEVLEAMRSARLLLHPSLHDSGGNVIVEALRHGVPVVCWNHAGPGAMVDGSCGAAVDCSGSDLQKALEGMASAVRRLATDPTAWSSASSGALERARSYFSSEAHAQRIDASYREAVARHQVQASSARASTLP